MKGHKLYNRLFSLDQNAENYKIKKNVLGLFDYFIHDVSGSLRQG